jgi:hypothetical protein
LSEGRIETTRRLFDHGMHMLDQTHAGIAAEFV